MGVDGSVGDVHSSQDTNCSSRTDVHNQKMKPVAQRVTPLVLRILSVDQIIKLVD